MSSRRLDCCYLLPVVSQLNEPSKDTDRVITFPCRVFDARRRVNHCIRHLPLNKNNSVAGPLEQIAEVEDPRVVLPLDVSRTGDFSTEKFAPLDARIFHQPSWS